MQMFTNDNSINARFCWQTRIHSRVISILSATPTDCLKKQSMLVNLFSAEKKKKIRHFRFSFSRESSFPRRIPGSELFVSCVCKRRWRLGGRSAVKCRKAIFAYVAKRKSSSRTLCTCWNRIIKKNLKKKEILILKVWFYGNSVKLRQSPTHVNKYKAKDESF